MVLTYEVKLYPNKRQEAELSRFYLTVTNNPMSTKKERCCGCPEKQDLCRGECICHHPQSESIEWEREFEKAKGTFEVYGEFGMGIDYKKLKEAFSKAITTAVAKREFEIAEEVGNMAGWNYDGTKAGNRDCPLIHREAVIQIIKH